MKTLKDFFAGKLHVRVYDSRQAMGDSAGGEIAACLKALLSEKETVNVMFAAAPSQNEVLQKLTSDSEIDWSRINAFHMDEYIGLDDMHPAGFRRFLKRAIFDKKPFLSVNLLNGNANNPALEAERYHQLLVDHPLDVCVLGIGENGHIAFNDPPVADFNDEKYVKIVALEDACRLQQVHDGCFGSIEEVPSHALTVTIPGLCSARYMFCSVPASTKANAIKHTVEDDVSTACPATVLKTVSNANLYVDADAAKFIL